MANRTPPSDGLAQLLAEFVRQKSEYEQTTLRCGIVGRSGVGKSSLINAITGERLAPVGFGKETTVAARQYQHRGLVLVDLPGCGTERYPTTSYVRDLGLESYDFFIFLTEGRFFQDDKVVYSQLAQSLRKPCFLARNKFDLVLDDASFDGANLTPEEIKADIARNMRESLAPLSVPKVYMVSTRRPAHLRSARTAGRRPRIVRRHEACAVGERSDHLEYQGPGSQAG